MHGLRIKYSIDRWINHIIKRKNIPAIISGGSLPQLHIKSIQILWFMILRIWCTHRGVNNRHQIMLVQWRSWIWEFRGNKIH